MKRSKIIWTALALLAGFAGNALAEDARWVVKAKGVVEDTFTETQWTQRDNLGDINWNDATAHCANLKLDGGGWQLPTMNDLSQLYSGAHSDRVSCGAFDETNFTCHAPKQFYLTGPAFWSSEPNGSSSALLFTLNKGFRFSPPVSNSGAVRALCVRHGS